MYRLVFGNRNFLFLLFVFLISVLGIIFGAVNLFAHIIAGPLVILGFIILINYRANGEQNNGSLWWERIQELGRYIRNSFVMPLDDEPNRAPLFIWGAITFILAVISFCWLITAELFSLSRYMSELGGIDGFLGLSGPTVTSLIVILIALLIFFVITEYQECKAGDFTARNLIYGIGKMILVYLILAIFFTRTCWWIEEQLGSNPLWICFWLSVGLIPILGAFYFAGAWQFLRNSRTMAVWAFLIVSLIAPIIILALMATKNAQQYTYDHHGRSMVYVLMSEHGDIVDFRFVPPTHNRDSAVYSRRYGQKMIWAGDSTFRAYLDPHKIIDYIDRNFWKDQSYQENLVTDFDPNSGDAFFKQSVDTKNHKKYPKDVNYDENGIRLKKTNPKVCEGKTHVCPPRPNPYIFSLEPGQITDWIKIEKINPGKATNWAIDWVDDNGNHRYDYTLYYPDGSKHIGAPGACIPGDRPLFKIKRNKTKKNSGTIDRQEITLIVVEGEIIPHHKKDTLYANK